MTGSMCQLYAALPNIVDARVPITHFLTIPATLHPLANANLGLFALIVVRCVDKVATLMELVTC